jgi:hypothetical protein
MLLTPVDLWAIPVYLRNPAENAGWRFRREGLTPGLKADNL